MAFSGIGHRLGDGECEAMEIETTLLHPGVVPTLKDICLSTLDRYIDLLEDIGSTPYYLIESVLRKCNVKQLTRVELHTEGLDEFTDELWYIHAKNDFKHVREGWPCYDESGEWRSKYNTLKQDDEDRLERKRALLRESYSQHDKFKQDRRVIMDPNLRLPKKSRTTSSSGWSAVAPKKKTLFEKARQEARRITQMYNTGPYPPPRNRIDSSSSSGTRVRAEVRTHTGLGSSASGSNPRHIFAPRPLITQNSTHNTPGIRSNSAQVSRDFGFNNGRPLPDPVSPTLTKGKRYSYKTRPIVYTPLGRSVAPHSPEEPTSPSNLRMPAGHKLITPTAPGAIVNFFKEINPAHSHATSSYRNNGDSLSRSPPSPPEPPSRTIQMLREDAGTASRYNISTSSLTGKKSDQQKLTLGSVKGNDFRWLEEDDDQDMGNTPKKVEKYAPKPTANKKPLSLEEAGRQFFNQV
ncbi:Elongin-A [Entomortierella beljakovae]|nr:Elongin-A [Entomortierella beljakovae]